MRMFSSAGAGTVREVQGTLRRIAARVTVLLSFTATAIAPLILSPQVATAGSYTGPLIAVPWSTLQFASPLTQNAWHNFLLSIPPEWLSALPANEQGVNSPDTGWKGSFAHIPDIDLDAPVLLSQAEPQQPSMPVIPVTSPVIQHELPPGLLPSSTAPVLNQEVRPMQYITPSYGTAATPLHVIHQAAEYATNTYDHFIDFHPVSTTTVNANQTINTFNTITISQTCGSNCTQVANPSASATTNASQTINASSHNTNGVVQINGTSPSTGSGSVAGGVSGVQGGAQVNTNVSAGLDAVSANNITVSQLSGDNDATAQQSTAVPVDAQAGVQQDINAMGTNGTLILQQ